MFFSHECAFRSVNTDWCAHTSNRWYFAQHQQPTTTSPRITFLWTCFGDLDNPERFIWVWLLCELTFGKCRLLLINFTDAFHHEWRGNGWDVCPAGGFRFKIDLWSVMAPHVSFLMLSILWFCLIFKLSLCSYFTTRSLSFGVWFWTSNCLSLRRDEGEKAGS